MTSPGRQPWRSWKAAGLGLAAWCFAVFLGSRPVHAQVPLGKAMGPNGPVEAKQAAPLPAAFGPLQPAPTEPVVPQPAGPFLVGPWPSSGGLKPPVSQVQQGPALPPFGTVPPSIPAVQKKEDAPTTLELKVPEPVHILLDSEAGFKGRLRQELLRQKKALDFPKAETTSPPKDYAPRYWPPMVETVEPNFLCYRRLFFEQPLGERYGREVGGVFHPLISGSVFYLDVVTLPIDLVLPPWHWYECNGQRWPETFLPFLEQRD